MSPSRPIDQVSCSYAGEMMKWMKRFAYNSSGFRKYGMFTMLIWSIMFRTKEWKNEMWVIEVKKWGTYNDFIRSLHEYCEHNRENFPGCCKILKWFHVFKHLLAVQEVMINAHFLWRIMFPIHVKHLWSSLKIYLKFGTPVWLLMPSIWEISMS